MPEWNDIKTYISKELELPTDSIAQNSLVVDLMCSSGVHEDEMGFFVLNFLDNYKIYCEERELNRKYFLPRNAVIRFIVDPFYRFFDVRYQDQVNYLHLTAKNLLEMANSKKWVEPDPIVYPEPEFLEPEPGQPMLVLRLMNRRAYLTDFLEELASPEMQKLNWFPDAAGEVKTSFDWAVHFLFDDTLLFDAPLNEVGWFLYTIEEVEAVKKLTEAIDDMLHRYGDVAGSEYVNKPQWRSVVSAAKIANDLVQKNNKLAEVSKAGS